MKFKGHQEKIKFLQELFQSSKLPHALLFTGPEGIGKKLVALHLAQMISCEKNVPCEACHHCQRILQRNHPDFFFIEPEEGIIKVDVIRNLKQRLFLTTLEATLKIAIINDAHTLHLSAANALLKTLEEPPSNTLIILITSSPYKLLRTILSRCQKLTFSPLTSSDMEAVIQSFESNEPVDPELLDMSAGSPGLFQKFSEEAQAIITQKILPSLESQPKDLMKLLGVAEELAKQKELSEGVLNLLLMHFEKKLPENSNLSFAHKMESIFHASQKLKETHINPQLTFENLFLKLCL